MKLPICFPPPVLLFAHHFIPTTIICAYDNTLDWYYSNFIQLCIPRQFNPRAEFLNFYPAFMTEQNSVFLTLYKLNEKLASINENNLIDHIIDWLNNNFYFVSFINGAEIPGTFLHSVKDDRLLEAFIFGYDREEELFQLLGFNRLREIKVINITFNDFKKAFFSSKTKKLLEEPVWTFGDEFCITLYQFNKNAKYKLDRGHIANQIKEYLNSENSATHYRVLNTNKIDYLFGMDIYEVLIDYLSEKELSKIDFKIFHGLWEHKRIMMERIKYLTGLNYLTNSNNYADRYSSIEKQAQHIRMLSLKFRKTFDKEIIKRISNSMYTIKADETVILQEFYKDLMNQ